MKEKCFYFFFFILIIYSSNVNYKRIFSNDSYNENIYPVINPINGTDYWKSKPICCNNYAEWQLELLEETFLYDIEIEFDIPPTFLVIYASRNLYNWLPIYYIDYKANFTNITHIPDYIIVSNKVNFEINIPFKYVKLKMINGLNLPFSIMLTKFRMNNNIVNTYIIRRLYWNNNRLNHLCLRFEDNFLKLSDCYYCIMYNIDKCTFSYNKTDFNGHLFKYDKDSINKEFYIRNLESNYTSDKSLKSFLYDKVEFQKELESINSNSTISEDYHIRNILDDNLKYWSSELKKMYHCKTVAINLNFTSEIVIKSLSIDWIKFPYKFKIKYCDADFNCQMGNDYYEIFNYRTRINDIFIKTKYLYIYLYANHSSNDKFCIFSIKQIFISKNTIVLNTEYKSNNLQIFSDNFYITRVNNNISSSDQVYAMENYQKTQRLSNDIEKLSSSLEDRYIDLGSELKQSIQSLFNELSDFLDSKSDIIDNCNLVKKLLVSYFGTSDIINNKIDMNELKGDSDYEIFNNFKKFIKSRYNFDFINFMETIEKNKKKLNNLILDNSDRFNDLLSDNNKKKTFESIEKIYHLYKKINKLKNLSQYTDSLQLIKNAFIEIRKNKYWDIKDKFDNLENQSQELIDNNKFQLDLMLQKLNIELQNIKLIKIEKDDIYLNLAVTKHRSDFDIEIEECKKFTLIKNAYYNDYISIIMITFNSLTTQSENIVIIKYFDNNNFYYLKIYFQKIEIWKKTYNLTKKIHIHDISEDNDKNYKIASFSKLVFLMVRVQKGILKLINKNIYNEVPDSIKEHLNGVKEINFDTFKDVYNRNENHFQDYFKNSTLIFEMNEVDLNLNSMLAYYSSFDDVHFLMLEKAPKELPTKEPPREPLKTKYNFNYFKNALELREIEVPLLVTSLLDLDSTWKSYDMDFEVVNSFYFKFDLNLDFLFNNVIYFIINPRTTDYYIFEIIRLENSFIFKIIRVNKSTGLKHPVYRHNIDYVKNSKVTFIISKTNDIVSIIIKNKSQITKNFFTFRNLNFIRFYLLLNNTNKNSISSIYFTNTLDFLEKEKIMKKCSLDKFKDFQCNDKPGVCKKLFCENCCKNRIIKNNGDCIQGCKDKLNTI